MRAASPETGREALSWVIRGCVSSPTAGGEAAEMIRHAYGMGVIGCGDDDEVYRGYVSRRLRRTGRDAGEALTRIMTLRSAAYRLGCADAKMLSEL